MFCYGNCWIALGDGMRAQAPHKVLGMPYTAGTVFQENIFINLACKLASVIRNFDNQYTVYSE